MARQDRAQRAARVERSQKKTVRFQAKQALQQAASMEDDDADNEFADDDNDLYLFQADTPRPRGME